MPIDSPQNVLQLTPVSLTLNRPDVEKLDDLALKQQTNRSALMRAALRQFLAQEEQADQPQGRKAHR